MTKNKTAVLAFGRMNPPTTGHEKLINKTHQVAKQHGGTAHVVASHSHDNDKNPLPQDKKLGYLRKVAHPDVKVSGSSKEHPSILHHASKLHAAGHSHLVVVAGGGREKEFHEILNKYNGKKSDHGHYNFKSIKVVSSGKRDPDAEGTEGISGSKMRDYARSGQHDKFKQGLPKALHPHAKEIHGHVTGGTQLESFKEQIDKKKKFKLSGKKTPVIIHINPSFDRSDVGYGYTSKKGSPPSKGGRSSARFGEGRVDNRILSFREDIDVDELFTRLGKHASPSLAKRNPDRIRKAKTDLEKLKAKFKKHNARYEKTQIKPVQLAAGLTVPEERDTRLTPGVEKAIKVASVRRRLAAYRDDRKKTKPLPQHAQGSLIRRAPKAEEVDLEEVLTRQARIKKALILRRFKHKIQRRKKMLRKKLATKEMLHKRSRRHAIKLVRKRFMGKKGEMYDKLGMADKIIIDKKVATKRKIIDRIAARLMPKIRRAELVRLRTMKSQKTSSGTGSYTIAKNVKSESYDIVTEGNIFDIVDNFYTLTEKDLSAMEKKINKSDIDPNILFEVFTMGLTEEGPGTPQQKGFHSLSTFIASIDKSESLDEALASWDDQPIQGANLDRRYIRPMIKRSTLPSLKEFQATGERSFVSDPVDPKKIDWKDSHTLAAYKMGKGSGNGKKNPFHKKNDPEGQLHTCWNMGNRGDPIPEALSYPHQTAKKYKKDTPGQEVKELDTSTLLSYQSKASDARKHRNLSTKKLDKRYAGVKRASDKLAAVDEAGEVRTGDIQLQKFRDPRTGKIKFRKVKRLAHGRERERGQASGETGEGEVGGRGETVEDASDAAVAKARHTIQQGRLKLQHARQKKRNDANRERMTTAQKQRHQARYSAAKANESFEQFMEIQNNE